MYKSLYIFHYKAKKKRKFEKIHLMLIAVNNVDYVIYSSYKNSFYQNHENQKLKNFAFHAEFCRPSF